MSEPPIQGQVFPNGVDGRYRLWTMAELPWNRAQVPALADGGPLVVTVAPWDAAVRGTGDGKWRIDALNMQTGGAHDLDGATYDVEDDAYRAAYDAGIVAFLIHEIDRHRYGLGPVTVE